MSKSNFALHSNARSVQVTVPVEDYIIVYSYNSLAETHLHYYLSYSDYEKLASCKSVSALLKYAKANHIFRDYPKPSCSLPPKTSEHVPYTDKAEVEGNSLSFVYPVNGTALPFNLE